MLTTGDKVILKPLLEKPSDTIIVPARDTRYRNGKLSICGEVIAVGPKVQGVEVGSYAFHSDSCFAPVRDGKLNVIRQSDIMFLSDKPFAVQWIGAEETYV